jgi:hypothetical protein
MRTHVEPRADDIAVAVQDQRLVVGRVIVERQARPAFEETAVLDLVDAGQGPRSWIGGRHGLTKSSHASG